MASNHEPDTIRAYRENRSERILRQFRYLVARLIHEINTPIGAIRSMNDTKSKAVAKLQTALENIDPDIAGKEPEIEGLRGGILEADRLIHHGTERLNEIVKNLKYFAKLDEATATTVDIHKGLDSVLALLGQDLPTSIEVSRIPFFPLLSIQGRLDPIRRTEHRRRSMLLA